MMEGDHQGAEGRFENVPYQSIMTLERNVEEMLKSCGFVVQTGSEADFYLHCSFYTPKNKMLRIRIRISAEGEISGRRKDKMTFMRYEITES